MQYGIKRLSGLSYSAVIAIIVCSPLYCQLSQDVAFIEGREVRVANKNGADIRVIATDADALKPAWARSGALAYASKGISDRDPKSLALIHVIEPNGVRDVVPIRSSEADGTPVGGMRFLESFGWIGGDRLFAIGSVNPYKDEFRIIRRSDKRIVASYFGSSFSACSDAEKTLVAYVDSTRSGETRVSVNEVLVRTLQTSSTEPFPTIHLSWLNGCSDLVMIAGLTVEGPATLSFYRSGIWSQLRALDEGFPKTVIESGESLFLSFKRGWKKVTSDAKNGLVISDGTSQAIESSRRTLVERKLRSSLVAWREQ